MMLTWFEAQDMRCQGAVRRFLQKFEDYSRRDRRVLSHHDSARNRRKLVNVNRIDTDDLFDDPSDSCLITYVPPAADEFIPQPIRSSGRSRLQKLVDLTAFNQDDVIDLTDESSFSLTEAKQYLNTGFRTFKVA